MAPHPGPGASSFPSSSAMSNNLTSPSAFHQQIQIKPYQVTHSDNLSFDSRFINTIVPSQSPVAFATGGDLSTHLVPSTQDLLLDHHIEETQRQTTELLRDLTDETSPFTQIKRDPKGFCHEPWTPVNAVNESISLRTEQASAPVHSTQKRPHTDSGYAGSLTSRPRLSIPQPPNDLFEVNQSCAYDDPIDSTAQQIHFLPDQQFSQTPGANINIITPAPPPSIAADSVVTAPGHQTFGCTDCDHWFNTKSELTKHMARHDRRHKCDFPDCSRRTDGFATKNDLDRHKASVHQDGTVARKEYRCCVLGCKDPKKVWDRKDNFKAHVTRMHPSEDADTIVEQSFIGEHLPLAGRSISYGGSHTHDLGQPTFQSPSSKALNPSFSPNDNVYPTAVDPSVNAIPWAEEGDMYDSPSITRPLQQGYYSQLDVSQHEDIANIHTTGVVPSVTAGFSNHTSSSTMQANSNPQDNMRPTVNYRTSWQPPVFPNAFNNMNHMASPAARTAPIIGYSDDFQSQFPDWPGGYDGSSMAESAIPAIDPILQTLHSGGWQSTSPTINYPQQADILDTQARVVSASASEEPKSSGPAIDEQRTSNLHKLIAEFENKMGREQFRLMFEAFQNHPTSGNKDKCAMKSKTESAKSAEKPLPYKCRRELCTKSFAQNNVRKKHEGRHDRRFFCTFDGCYSRFGSKDDLRRHEKSHEKKMLVSGEYQGWRCFTGDVPTSQHKIECSKFFNDEEKFQHHRRDDHRERATASTGGLKALKNCYINHGQPGNFWCGFCDKVIINEPNATDGTKCDKFRYDHIDQHITKDKMTRKQWVDLKSEGLTKKQVKSSSRFGWTAATDDSDEDDEDDSDQLSPDASATIAAPSLYAPARTNSQHLEVPRMDARGRKRALSNAEFQAPGTFAKRPRTLYNPPPRHAPMTRVMSDTVTTGFRPAGHGIKQQPSAPPRTVTCCQCSTQRHFNVPACANFFCFYHPKCATCIVLDNNGNQIFPRPDGGSGQGR